jgi:hypothetical protein
VIALREKVQRKESERIDVTKEKETKNNNKRIDKKIEAEE